MVSPVTFVCNLLPTHDQRERERNNPLAAANDFAPKHEVLCNEPVGTNVHYRRLLGEATRRYRSVPQFHAALHEVDYQPDHHKLLIGEAV
jgi:hypothetical protein